MSFLNPILAQVVAAPEKFTVGTVIAAALFLMTAAGSMAMIVAWGIRFGQTGNALPAARRGVLRVPWPLTLVAVALSVLLMALMLTSSFVDPVPVVNNVVAAKPAEVEIDPVGTKTTANEQRPLPATEPGIPEPALPGAEVTDSADVPVSEVKNTDGVDAGSLKKKSIDPVQMKNAVIQTIVMDIMMLLAFGSVVLVASNAGRVYLQDSPVSQSPQSMSRATMPQQSSRAIGTGMGFDSPWPDLNDASSIPQMPGYDILGNRGVKDPGRNSYETSADAHASPILPVSPASRQLPETAQQNPFAVVLDDEPFGTDTNATDPVAAEPRIADEPFSFSRELRFAAEVFLAAYLPTTALRLLIVVISMSISGEPPDSHPFLEMLEAGVSVPMILMILIMAVFVAPIVEELQFRVVILGGIAQLGKPVLALIGSSILFSFAHGFPDSIALIPLALALGYTYLRRRSYVTVMLVHFLFNGFNMILALAAMF